MWHSNSEFRWGLQCSHSEFLLHASISQSASMQSVNTESKLWSSPLCALLGKCIARAVWKRFPGLSCVNVWDIMDVNWWQSAQFWNMLTLQEEGNKKEQKSWPTVSTTNLGLWLNPLSPLALLCTIKPTKPHVEALCCLHSTGSQKQHNIST